MHTSKMGLLLHMILHITPLFIGLAGLHRFMSSPDLSPYSAVLMKTEWLQENFMVADKIYHFFCGNEMMSDNWSEIKWDAYSSGQVQDTLLGNSRRWICQQDFVFPKSVQFFSYTCVFFFFFVCFFLSFTKLQINIYFYWRNVPDGYDLVPKLKYARERG